MASKNSKGRRSGSAAPDDNRIEFSSGYVGIVEPISYATFQLLKQREVELFPEPELPMKQIEVAGGVKNVPATQQSAEGVRFMVEMTEIAQKRAEFRLDYFIDRFLTVEGAEDETGRQELLSKHETGLAMVADLRGEPIEDDEERWALFLRHIALRSSADYKKLKEKVESLTAPITDNEVLLMAELFRRLVAQQADHGVEASGDPEREKVEA